MLFTYNDNKPVQQNRAFVGHQPLKTGEDGPRKNQTAEVGLAPALSLSKNAPCSDIL